MLVYHHISQKAQDEEIRQAKILAKTLKNKVEDLKNSKRQRRLSQEQFEYICDNYKQIPTTEIAKKLKRAVATVKNIAQKLGLGVVYLNDNEITLNTLYYVLTGCNIDCYQLNLMQKWGLKMTDTFPRIANIYDFYDWYKSHIRIIQIHNYEIGTLPDEPEWFIEKAQADRRAFEYKYKRQWSKEEDLLLMKLVEERKTYFECSKILKRTGSAIKRRCYDLNLKKPKRTNPVFWKDEDIAKLKDLWLKGYETCIIAEEINRSDREIISFLERNKYYGMPPQKFNSPQ